VAARLEQRLGRAVMNLALIGIGARRAHELLTQSQAPLAGRTVVQLVTEANDLNDSIAERGGRPSPGFTERSFTQNTVLWLQRWLQPSPFEAERQRGQIGAESYWFFWVDAAAPRLAAEVPAVLEQLQATHAAVEAQGGRHVLVLVPSKYRVLHPLCMWPAGSRLADPRPHLSPLRQAVAEHAVARGIPLLDLTETLQRSAAAGQVPYFAADTHLNAHGHAVLAEALAAWLEHMR
jgi:lysophospholipase L1-like esterase